MAPLIILGALVLVPVVGVFFLRSNGALVFLTVALGSVLATYVAGDTADVITAARQGSVLSAMQWVQLVLLALPPVLAVFLTRHKSRGIKLILSTVAAAAAGGLLALLAVPYLSSSLQDAIQETVVWHQLDSLQTLLILVGAVLVFTNLFGNRYKPDKHDKHSKKKHK